MQIICSVEPGTTHDLRRERWSGGGGKTGEGLEEKLDGARRIREGESVEGSKRWGREEWRRRTIGRVKRSDTY